MDEIEEKNDLIKQEMERTDINDQLKEEIHNDLAIDTNDLINCLRKAPDVAQKYQESYFIERRRLIKYEMKKKMVERELFEHYKTNFQIKITSSQDIWVFIEGDKKHQNISKLVKYQETLVDFYEKLCKKFENRNWLIKDMVRLLELESKNS